MIENLVVFGIVGAVLLLAARSLYRTLTGKNDGCGCGKASCAAAGHCPSSQATKKTGKAQTDGD